MKYATDEEILKMMKVAPLVGAWIEMMELHNELELHNVAPLVGAWIEILLL